MSRVISLHLIVALLCLSALESGCSLRRVSYNDPISLEQSRFIEIGRTTLTEVVQQLGAPDDISEAEPGFVALYFWSHTTSAGANFGQVARLFLPYAPNFTLSRTGIALHELQVVFDPNWTVRAYGFSRDPEITPGVWFWPL